MEKNILKKGTKVISFAPDSESTNELGIITDSYQFNGRTHYDVHTDDIEKLLITNPTSILPYNFHIIQYLKFSIPLTPHDIKLNDYLSCHR